LTKLETGLFAGKISDLDWDMEAKKIVVGGEGSGILVKCVTWDTGNTVGEMVGHTKRVLSVAYKPSRPFRIFTASEDFRTIFYAGPPFKLDHSMSSHTNFVNCVRYSPDGNRVISVGTDKKIQAYDGKTGEPSGEVLDAHAGGIYSVAFSPDNAYFITASADKTVKLWNAETLALEQTFTIAADPQVGDAQVAVLWTKFAMLSVSLNGNINILNRANPAAPERLIQAHQFGISAMGLDRASGTLLTASLDGVVCRRSLAAGCSGPGVDCQRMIGTDKRNICGGAHGGKITGLAVVNGTVVSVGWDDKMRFSAVGADAYDAREVTLEGQPCGLATGTNFSSSSDLVAVVTTAEVALYRGEAKVSSISVSALGFAPTCAALLNEEEIAIGGADFKTHVYALQAGDLSFSPVATIETRSAVSALAYSPAGDVLAVGDEGRQVELHERGTWAVRLRGKWVFHTSRITCLAWSPDGKYLASGSLDENIFIWNAANPGAKLQFSFSHMGGVSGLDWLPVAEGAAASAALRLVSVGNDFTVVTWNFPAFE
jgi:WD repeat-containing protein 1 (actin-interacting protein 1)